MGMAPDPEDEIPVESSNLKTIWYDRYTSELYVRFKSGVLYRYTGVPLGKWQGLKEAVESHGKYLNLHIRGYYPFNIV